MWIRSTWSRQKNNQTKTRTPKSVCALIFKKRRKIFYAPFHFCKDVLYYKRKEGADMIYTVEELKRKISPIAKQYGLKAVYLFGSYARNEATDNSDVDILIDRTDSKIKGMFDMGGLYSDLQESIGKSIDLVTTQTLEQTSTRQRVPYFVENLYAERLKIYE